MAQDSALTAPTTMSLFMRDMVQFPLLTKEQEELLSTVILHHKKELTLELAKTIYFLDFLKSVQQQHAQQPYAYQRLFVKNLKQVTAKRLLAKLITTLEGYHEGIVSEIDVDHLITPIELNWPLLLDDGLIKRIADMRTATQRGIPSFIGITPAQAEKILILFDQLLAHIKQFENHNIRLVVSIAKTIVKGQLIEDRIQWGYLGLRKAIWRFDPTTGNKFSTYATWWIKQTILREYMNTARLIRLPIHQQDKLKALKSKRQTQYSASFDEALNEDDAILLPEDMQQLHELERLDSILSLEAPLNNDHDSGNLLDIYHTQVDDQFVEEYERKDIYEKVLAQIHRLLSTREAHIIISRYVDGRTLEDIGAELNVSRERIRQLEAKALQTLRNSPLLRKIIDI